MSSKDEQNATESENTCVVCFKSVEIYSIGICDHPVCFECSTRMRVLCLQNECPICRGDMPKVIFTKRVEPYSQLIPRVDRSNALIDKKFGLHFCSVSIQRAYYKLLEHNCQICGEDSRRWPFKTFQQLKDHVRREHELFYCDLCVENLKIFTFERRCYTRSELAHHKRKGDADNTSHRGHPLCEFCDVRYMDSDELFRHLRREHLYCHFCDADGKHQYYNSYTDLRTHFLDEHYLCEEGECKNEIFTSAFRTDIDLKAHIAQVHSKHLKGAAHKQARTLDIEFTLAPRPRPNHNHSHSHSHSHNHGHGHGHGHSQQHYQQGQNDRLNDGIDNYYMEPGGSSSGNGNRKNQNTFVNPLSADDFPSLTTIDVPIPSSSRVKFTSKISSKPFSPDDFPSLGIPTRTSSVTITGSSSSSRGPTMVMQGSVPVNRNANKNNFPALGESSKHSSGSVKLSVNQNSNDASGKGASAAAANVSIHLKNSNGAVTTRIQSDPSRAVIRIRPQSMVEDFPALGPKSSSSPSPAPQWITAKAKKQQEPKSSRVAPAPILPPSDLMQFPALSSKNKERENKEKSSTSSTKKPSLNASTPAEPNLWVNLNNVSKSKENNNNNNSKSKNGSASGKSTKINNSSNNSNNNNNNKKEVNGDDNVSKSKGKKSKKGKTSPTNNVNNNDVANKDNSALEVKVKDKEEASSSLNGTIKKRSELNIQSLHVSDNNSNSGLKFKQEDFPSLGGGQSRPPPGFNIVKPPPGLGTITTGKKSNSANIVLSQPKSSASGLTFTNSSGQSYPITSSNNSIYQYHTPPNFQARNRSLFESFMAVVKSSDVLRDFKNYSDLFRNGNYSAEKYYEHCRIMLGNKFEELFCELLVLLPNVEKQLELYKVYKEKSNANNLDVCSMCNQVVLTKELQDHFKNHEFDNQYPALGASSSLSSPVPADISHSRKK